MNICFPLQQQQTDVTAIFQCNPGELEVDSYHSLTLATAAAAVFCPYGRFPFLLMPA